MASGLTISPHHTPNIRQTQNGFECEAFFPPKMITENGAKGKEVINEVIKVRMQVNLEDILFINGRQKGGQGDQIDLYPGGKTGELYIGG